MSSFRIRPRFKHVIQGEKDELEIKIRSELEQDNQFIYHYLPGHLYINPDYAIE